MFSFLLPDPKKEQYKRHLASPYWREFKAQYMKSGCENCGSRYNLDAHHITYKHFGYEKQYSQDVITICRRCHDFIHYNGHSSKQKDWYIRSNAMVAKIRGIRTVRDGTSTAIRGKTSTPTSTGAILVLIIVTLVLFLFVFRMLFTH